MSEQEKYLVALHSTYGMTNQRLSALMNYFEHDAERAWHTPGEWQKLSGWTARQASELAEARYSVAVEAVYEHFCDSYASLMTLTDPAYPPLLADIYDPPYLFFYYGQLPRSEELTVAMIGSRTPTNYGKQVAPVLAREVAAQGIWVVSGMARGLDSACHEGALAAGGKTVAVLGSGLDVIYPPEKSDLYRRIIDQGAVISEWPFGAAPEPHHFPLRNRVISGLSRGLVVIEAKTKSGTLITADRAMEQNRDLFAVPGPITSRESEGTNALIVHGAKLVSCGKDIWSEYLPEDYQPQLGVAAEPQADDSLEQQLLELLRDPTHFDQLADKLGLPAPQLAAKLTMWEIKGLIEQLPGKYYVRKIHRL